VKAAEATAAAQLTSGNPVWQVTRTQSTWQEINLDAIRINRSTNRLQFLVACGAADLDWIKSSPAQKASPRRRDDLRRCRDERP
jgi:hypothetical protein